MSLFISFEGGEGSGKSTQIELLQKRLLTTKFTIVPIQEPGTTQLGLQIRNLLKGGAKAEKPYSKVAELLLFAAARAELVANIIQPTLALKDKIIVTDRYLDSTTAYQGYGRGIEIEQVRMINKIASNGLTPDLTFLLDCPPEEGLKRIGSFQLKLPLERTGMGSPAMRNEEGTRFEREPLQFHKRVRDGYLKIAAAEPNRWCVIEATKSPKEINTIVWQNVQHLIGGQNTTPHRRQGTNSDKDN